MNFTLYFHFILGSVVKCNYSDNYFIMSYYQEFYSNSKQNLGYTHVGDKAWFLGCCHQNELSPTSITSIDVALNQTPVWSSETLNKIKKSSPNIFKAKSTTFDSQNKLCYSDLWFDCGIILPISSCNLILCCCQRYRRSICYLFFLELTLCYGFLKFSQGIIYLKL